MRLLQLSDLNHALLDYFVSKSNPLPSPPFVVPTSLCFNNGTLMLWVGSSEFLRQRLPAGAYRNSLMSWKGKGSVGRRTLLSEVETEAILKHFYLETPGLATAADFDEKQTASFLESFKEQPPVDSRQD